MDKIILLFLFCQILSGTDLYVGYPRKSNNFENIQEAVNQAANINPSNEEERVTIHIAPGVYRLQIVIDTPYITFINDDPSSGDVLITWYYGIGYKYYSQNEGGMYDKTLAEKKSSKNGGSWRWGATVHVNQYAKYFKAQNIVFENSLNRYMTEEEIEDGVEVTGDTIKIERTPNLDVKSREATERAAAMSIEADYVEFLNCRFYSSQDTLYTGGSPLYFRNCLIEGQTDYIFGGSNAVFDNCELRWKGYSKGTSGGFITAASGDSTFNYTGYLFNNCKVTKNKALNVKSGHFGRPWRQQAKVMFLNTILEDDNTILPEGWAAMGGVPPEKVEGFFEYGTKLENGAKVSLSKRKGHILSQTEAENINYLYYLHDWTPSFMEK